MSDKHVFRREVLSGCTTTIAGISAVLAVSAATRDARADNASDVVALNAVRVRAYEIIAVYDAAVGFLMGMADGATVAALIQHFRQQHRDSADRLGVQITAMMGNPISQGSVNAPANPTGFTRSVANYLKYASNLEKSAATDNASHVNTIGSKDAAELVAAIVGTQSQHFIALYLMARGIFLTGPMAASMLNEIVPRSFVSIETAPATSLTSVDDFSYSS